MAREAEMQMLNSRQLEHYNEICNQGTQVANLRVVWDKDKETTKASKAEYEAAMDVLCRMIDGGPDWQERLKFEEE